MYIIVHRRKYNTDRRRLISETYVSWLTGGTWNLKHSETTHSDPDIGELSNRTVRRWCQ